LIAIRPLLKSANAVGFPALVALVKRGVAIRLVTSRITSVPTAAPGKAFLHASDTINIPTPLWLFYPPLIETRRNPTRNNAHNASPNTPSHTFASSLHSTSASNRLDEQARGAYII